MDKKSIGNNIKFYRKNAGLTQAELGEMFGVSYVTVSTWESGRTTPSIDIKELVNIEAEQHGYYKKNAS